MRDLPRRLAISLAALVALRAPPALGQFGLERVLSNINVANLNAQGSCLLNESAVTSANGGKCGLYGWGVEVALALSPDTAKTSYQFALGYGQVTGFKAKNPNLDIHGMLRLAPEVSFYVTHEVNKWIIPYVGVHTGIVTLSNIQAYTPGDTLASFNASTLQFGATFGLFLPLNLYVDTGFRYRDFNALEWRTPRGVLPTGWPKSIVMNVMQVTVGYQFDVGSLTGKKK